MSDNLIIRNFDDATFVFNTKNRKSLFVEGTIADIVPFFLKHPNKQTDENYLDEIQPCYQLKAKKEIELVRKTVQDFLLESDNKNQSTIETVLPAGSTETPMQRLLAYAIKRWQIINASIELNYHCNLKCQCCYAETSQKKGLQRHELQKIAKQLQKTGAIFILFTGGEIFLRRDVFEIMNDFKQIGFVLEVKSNGTLLTSSVIRNLANLDLFNLQISVYDIANRFSEFTGKYYRFSALLENIRLATEQRISVSLSVLVGKHNIDDLEKYHDALQKSGTGEIFYNPYITPQRNGAGREKLFRLSRKEMDEKFYPFLEKIDGFTSPKKYRDCCKNSPACYAGREQIAIDPEGTIYPCLDLRLPIGNILQDNLFSILKKRKELLKPYTIEKISKCWRCGIAEYCDSCIGTSILEHGNFNKPSQHKCDIAHFYYDSDLKRKERR